MKPLSSLLIKPAGPDCNLACRYCFYLKKAALFSGPHHRMSEAVLKETVRQAMQQAGEHISFGWQGGEPTLMGYDFFHTAVQYQSRFGRPGQRVGNGLQTNGWLVDRYWAEFLADAKFLVGLSLDGPEHIHDHYRRTLADQGTWDRVVRSRDLLLQTGVEVNALIVVNDYSVQFPKEIYQFHKKSGITFMQFIPCMEPDLLDGSRPAAHSAPAEKYGAFLCTLLDLWLADFRYGKPTVSIRWFDSLFYTYVGLPAPECTLLQECGVYVVVEHNGDVYSCDFFVEPDWRLGNVMQDRLADLLNAPLQERFGRLKSGLAEKCRVCPWLPHCHGGCPKDRRVGRDGVDPLCPAYEQFFSYGHDKLVKLAEAWKRGQAVEPAADAGRVGISCGRNDPCPCGSGKKYKNCCINKR